MIKAGDTITSFALPGNGKGKVVKKYMDRTGYNGEDLYEIIDENGQTHSMVSSLFDTPENNSINEKESTVNNNGRDIERIKKEIDEEIDRIIEQLGLEKSSDVMVQLKNCNLVQKYIVETNGYNENIMKEKSEYETEDIVILDLYNAVVLHNGVCTSNSLMFKKILEKVGVNVEVVGLFSSEGGMHASNLVELDGEYYFFDSTLESSIYRDKGKDGNLILCCAGLGKNEYCQFYTPQVILPDNPTDMVKPIPKNISESRIPMEIINHFVQNDKDQEKQL